MLDDNLNVINRLDDVVDIRRKSGSMEERGLSSEER
jgi:hypothetical protein